MAVPWITLVAMSGVALAYVVAPIVATTFVRFQGKRAVRCPETGLAAEVEIDARHAALTAVPGPPRVRVAECSLWSARRGCQEMCLADAAAR